MSKGAKSAKGKATKQAISSTANVPTSTLTGMTNESGSDPSNNKESSSRNSMEPKRPISPPSKASPLVADDDDMIEQLLAETEQPQVQNNTVAMEMTICTPNPSAAQRRAGIKNTFRSKAEIREDNESEYHSESSECPGVRLHTVDGTSYLYQGKPTPAIRRSLEARTAMDDVEAGQVYDSEGYVAGVAIPMMSETVSYEDSKAIADFLSGKMSLATKTVNKPPKTATSSNSFFIHGALSYIGDTSEDKSPDVQEWSLPNSALKAKIMINRLRDLEEAPTWHKQFQHTLHQIIVILKSLGTKNPYHGLNEDEQRVALLSVFDISTLFKRKAIGQMSMQYFSGRDCRTVPPEEVHKELRRHIESIEGRVNAESILKQLKQLRMRNTTYNGAINGYTCSKNFEKFYLEFASVLYSHSALVEQYYSDNTILVHTFMTLIEPVTLRKTLIKYLAASIQKRVTVQLYGCEPMFVSLTSLWPVYQLLHDRIVAIVDPGMITSTKFLDTLVVQDFCIPHLSQPFLDMAVSPHQMREPDDSRDTSRKRHSNISPSESSDSKRRRTDVRTRNNSRERERVPYRDRDRDSKEREREKHEQRDPKANQDRRHGADGKANPREQRTRENSDRTKEHSTSARTTRDDDKRDRAHKDQDKGKDRTKTAANESKRVRTCCLCDQPGHKSDHCSTYTTCTCGKPTDGEHDPFRCKKGPLTEEGKKLISTLKKKKK